VPAGRALLVGNTDGIGLAVTRRLLAEGWTIAGLSRRASPLVDARYRHTVADVGAIDYRARLGELLASEPPFDVCIYCAGIGDLFDPDHLAGDADVVRVNLVGAVETAAAILPSMLGARRGHFVALSSIGDGISPEAPSYAASKAGLSSYLGGLALALRPHGVWITNVRLGFVDTKMAKARVRPFMIGADEAAAVVVRALGRRPARLTHPWRTAFLAWLLGKVNAVRLWLTRA
jgi:NAD(P)-dependent dehydrogenase (short-subunit alcohol dehydrogenase family)